MNEFKRKQWARIGLSVIAVAVAVLFLTGIIGGKPMTIQVKEPLTPMLQGITDTMEQNKENEKAEDYLEQDPYLVNIYEGFGFSKDYMAARGHAYTLEDVTKTQRPHGKANCITCKTPDFTKMVNAEGVEVYSRPFDEVMGQMHQAISCYTCHGDDKGNNGQIVITHSYVNEALGENASEIDPKVLNCGQCHIEYYFTPEDSETMMPYHSQEEMTPEAILAYYDEMGFKDWEQPGTGTPMLKAQHPEMETFLSSTHASMGLNCASCHMAEETASDGTTYHSHYLVSPLQSEKLMATCASCHGSADAAKSLVTSTQEKVTARETEVGNRLSALKDALTAAVTEAKMTEEELDAVRKLHREAQWFFDFCYVENSEGAHNSKLSIRCLDTADKKIAEAMALLNGEKPEEPAEEPETDSTTVTEQGFGGDVTVHLELNEDGTVKSLSIETPNETAGLGQRASEAAFTDQFIGKKGPFTFGEDGIEALSGATVTSNAALKAINGLVTGEKPAAETAEAKPAEEKTAEEKPAETEAPAEEPDGFKMSAMASEKGFGGIVTIRVQTDENQKVEALTIETPDETEGLGKRVSEAAFTDQFIGKTGPFTFGENGIEAVSGATVTSNAALTALNRTYGAQETAEENPAETEAPAEKTDDFKMAAMASEQGFGGQVTVHIEMDGEQKIKTLAIDTPDETEGLGKHASEAAFTDQFIGKTGPFTFGENGIEALSGATVTSNAALKAINSTFAAEEITEEKPAEEKPAETAGEADDGSYGSYLSEKETPFSTILVTVSTKGGKITDCKITSEAKSEGSDLLTDEIKKSWAEYIAANQNADMDAVSGVTVSSNAIKEAFAEIRGLMAAESGEAEAEPAEEKPAEEKPAEEKPAETAGEADDGSYGSYLSEKETPFSTILVTVSTKGGKITDCKITSEAKSEGSDLLTDEIKKSWAEYIAANQNADMDAVSGVTVSGNAVKEAFAEIQGLMAGEGTAAETPAEETETPAEEPAEAPAKVPAAFGGYLAVKETPFSVIRVIVSTQNGKITGCRVLCDAKEGQTDLVKDENRETWAKQIVESQGAEIDTVTGATVSSDAVKEAAAEILEKIR